VLILLPPSEGKAAATAGPALDLAALSFPQLTRTRERMLERLIRISGQRNALALLGLPPGLAAQVERNTRLRDAPAHAAELVYTGVLYEALALGSLSPEARQRAEASLLIFSGLFGVLRPGDAIPAYRLSMDVSLPRLGPLATAWRSVLGPVIEQEAGDRPIVDCRSSTYAAAWRPPRQLAGRVLTVRVLQEVAGKRTVVSHMAKLTRGRVARALLESSLTAGTPQHVIDVLGSSFRVEAAPPAPGASWRLDVIVEP
jgi:cytoplasmic iron level regulating protein YaaA (DUF328/UPF0246 family)